MYRPVIADLPQCIEKRLDGNHARGCWQLAGAIDLLVQRNSLRRIVEVHGNDVFVAQGEKIRFPFVRSEPVPAIKLNTHVASTDGCNEFFRLAQAMDERMPLSPPQGHRPEVFEAKFLAVIFQDL